MFQTVSVHCEDITPALLADVRNNKALNIEGEDCVIIPIAWWENLLDNILDEVVEQRTIERLKNIRDSKSYTFDEVASKLGLPGVEDIDE